MRIPLAIPSIGELERRYVTEAVASGWISGSGPYIDAFESALCTRFARRHVVAVSNGTVALELSLLALGIGPGDEVIVPALTFAAPAAAVRTVGAQPVLADVTAETWTIDPTEIAFLITQRTKAIIAVDVMGHPCDFDSLQAFDIPVIEDAAEAHGASYKGRSVGTFGQISIFSFHANKSITTGEGGCIATDNYRIAQQVRIIANHGMRPERPYYHEHVGRNARITNLTAAVGVAQAARWEELIAARSVLAERYRSHLAEIGCFGRPEASWATVSLWLQTVVLERRDAVIDLVRAAGIDARPIWPALSDLPLYYSSVRRACPVSSSIAATTAWLPTWSHMTEDLIIEIVEALALAMAQAK
jgi:perosamine synthetase